MRGREEGRKRGRQMQKEGKEKDGYFEEWTNAAMNNLLTFHSIQINFAGIWVNDPVSS